MESSSRIRHYRGHRLQIHPEMVAFSFESQVKQYPLEGEPNTIELYLGVQEGFDVPINCLLFRDEVGEVRGILNHYPIDYPPFERAGNVNVFVDPTFRRRGVAIRLIQEAEDRFGPLDLEQQRLTREGYELVKSIIRRHVGHKKEAP